MKPAHLPFLALVAALSATASAFADENTTPSPAGSPPAAPTKTKLSQGDNAPEVRFGEFIKGEPIRALDPEKTYVLEFWATHCSPCIAAFPHLNRMAKDLDGKVQFISVDVRDPDTDKVRRFVRNQGEKMSYPVTVDTTGFMEKTWLNAAGDGGIPTTFVVVKGKIAFIGHPIELDTKLIAGLRDGTFTAADLAEFRKQEKDAGNEFRASMRFPVETDAARREAVVRLRKLAVKYPKAKYPQTMIEYYEDGPEGK